MRRALIGAGGLASEISWMIGSELPCFVSDELIVDKATSNFRPLSEFDPKRYEVCIAIASPQVRLRIRRYLPESTRFFSYVHPSAILYIRPESIGIGSFIGCHVVVMNDVTIGSHVILNRFNQVGHNSKLGDFFTGLPSANIAGNVLVGQSVLMGSGSSILENLKVCNDVTIGAMACVTKNILRSGIYTGIPAKLKDGNF